MPSNSRKTEIAQLGTAYGAPVRRKCVLEVSQEGYEWWNRATHKRHGEVVMFIRCKNGKLILHTKEFYPAGALRVPSGTLNENEPLLDAVYREALEETSLEVTIERFLAIVEFEFRFQGRSHAFSSYLFLLHELGGELKPMDVNERISGFAEVAPADLPSVAECLENLPPYRRDWGRFRAFPHRLAAELLQDAARASEAS